MSPDRPRQASKFEFNQHRNWISPQEHLAMATHALIDASIVPRQGWNQVGESLAIQRYEKTVFQRKLHGLIQLSGRASKKPLALKRRFKFNIRIKDPFWKTQIAWLISTTIVRFWALAAQGCLSPALPGRPAEDSFWAAAGVPCPAALVAMAFLAHLEFMPGKGWERINL